MPNRPLHAASALLAAAVSLFPVAGFAQQGQDWFVPGQQRPGPGPRQAPPVRPAAPRPQPALPGGGGAPLAPQAGAPDNEPIPPQVQVQLPPPPEVPALPKGASPPAAVIGVLGLAEISRGSVAAQQVDKALNERMTKLHDDAQKEQAAWRDVQQQLASQRNGLNAEQVRAKERGLQERVTNAQRQFRDRNRIIQEAAQYARAQIERTLRSVVVQVAESRGINLVLHQEQVVLNYPAFDITQQVIEHLNKVLPSVVVPPDGVSVAQMPGAVPTAQAQPGAPGPGTPASGAAEPARPQPSTASTPAPPSTSAPPAPAAPPPSPSTTSQQKRP